MDITQGGQNLEFLDEFEISTSESRGHLWDIKGDWDRLDEDVAEKYDPSGVASGRTSQISDRYFSRDELSPTAKRYYTYRG